MTRWRLSRRKFGLMMRMTNCCPICIPYYSSIPNLAISLVLFFVVILFLLSTFFFIFFPALCRFLLFAVGVYLCRSLLILFDCFLLLFIFCCCALGDIFFKKNAFNTLHLIKVYISQKRHAA